MKFSALIKRFIFVITSIFPALLHAQAQKNLNTDGQRLLLQLSSGYYNVARLNEVSLDSSLSLTSAYFKISKRTVMTEGFRPAESQESDSWIDFNALIKAKITLKEKTGIAHADQMLRIGAYYAFQSGSKRADIDSALLYLNLAKTESEKLKDANVHINALILLGKCLFIQNNYEFGSKYFRRAVDESLVARDTLLAAKANNYLGAYCPFLPSTIAVRLTALAAAESFYHRSRAYTGEIVTLMYESYLFFAVGNLEKSTEKTTRALHLEDSIHFSYRHYAINMLSLIATTGGKFSPIIKHTVDAVKSAEETGDQFALSTFYSRLANAYRAADLDWDRVVEWDKKAFYQILKGVSPLHDGSILYNYTADLIENKKGKEAIELIGLFEKKFPADNPTADFQLSMIKGFCYGRTGQNGLAEYHFERAISLWDNISHISNVPSKVVFALAGSFYKKTRQYDKAVTNYNRFLKFELPAPSEYDTQASVYRGLYEIDSARRNYESALINLRKYVDVYNYIYNLKELRQLEMQKVSFETAQKEQSIRLLQLKAEADRSELQKIASQRNLTIVGSFCLLIVSGMIVVGYRNKRAANLRLSSQQDKINRQNIDLQELVKEKELLMKEMHHRVKNNLQLIQNLLESQSSALDATSLQAIQNSRGRLYAMTLIHQKLYMSENVTLINLSSYLMDLVNYVIDSFGGAEGIRFELSVNNVTLLVNQAIPVAIIVNEAITNALKYAFPDQRAGTISLRLTENSEGRIHLLISDDGIGLPDGLAPDRKTSMGLRLIKGLCRELKGKLDIRGSGGTGISVVFTRMPFELPDQENAGRLNRTI